MSIAEYVIRNDRMASKSECELVTYDQRMSDVGKRDSLLRSVSFRDESIQSRSFSPSDFDFLELLGKGFFGEVFKVVHRQTGDFMVIKRLYRLDAKCERDFLKEAAVMRQLDHPNVLRFLGVLYKDKQLHLVTEFIGAGTLRRLIEATEELPWQRRISLACDISTGMEYLHSKNIIHRDLNSGNILVREENGSAVVADFGLARVMSRRRAGRRRRLTVVGNPYLMAPEMMKVTHSGIVWSSPNVAHVDCYQLRQMLVAEENYDERVDVFSFGITLCEIIGRCSSDPDIMPRSKDFGVDMETFVSKFVDATCPRSFLELAAKCSHIDPTLRPSFGLLRRWLERLLSFVCSVCNTADCQHLVEEIRSFVATPEKSLPIDDIEKTPNRPSNNLTLNKRRISIDLGYSSVSPQSLKSNCETKYVA